MIDILCIGLAVYDLSLPIPGYPPENSKTEIQTSYEAGGGPAANAAYMLSKWGVNTAFAGIIGADIYGRLIIAEFEAVGTDISLLEARPGFQTPLAVILVNQKTGSRTVIHRRGKSEIYHPDFNISEKPGPKVLLFDGHEPDASLAAIEMFPQARAILDAGSLRPGTEILAGKVDYLVASEKFALSWTGLPDLKSPEHRWECLRRLAERNQGHITVTLGEAGLIHNGGGEYHYVPAFPAETVDTTGAGDIFHAAFAYGILQNNSLSDILRFASMTASMSVSVMGGRQSIPPLANVIKKLKGE
jgi:sugar/nucleoside kinase (ribokinase family)